jgi:hypothetical protein
MMYLAGVLVVVAVMVVMAGLLPLPLAFHISHCTAD